LLLTYQVVGIDQVHATQAGQDVTGRALARPWHTDQADIIDLLHGGFSRTAYGRLYSPEKKAYIEKQEG
jgi:hypothetical protein